MDCVIAIVIVVELLQGEAGSGCKLPDTELVIGCFCIHVMMINLMITMNMIIELCQLDGCSNVSNNA